MALFPLLLSLARSLFAPRLELMAEILVLHQQLAILNRTTKRPTYVFRIDCFGSPWRDSGRIGAPLCLSSNRRPSSNGIAKVFGFTGTGNQKRGSQADLRSLPKFVNSSTDAHKRIRCGARHVLKLNFTFLGSKLR